MARSLGYALVVFVLLATSQAATAQSLARAAAAARKAPQVEPALRADIEKLMEVTGQTAMSVQLASTISDAFLNAFQSETRNVVPPRVIQIVKEVFNTEFAQGFSGPEIKDKQIALYAKYFTHAEVKGLLAFYDTDLGRKTIANMPNLMREGGAIGEEWAKGAMPGMMEKLQNRLKSEGLIP